MKTGVIMRETGESEGSRRLAREEQEPASEAGGERSRGGAAAATESMRSLMLSFSSLALRTALIAGSSRLLLLTCSATASANMTSRFTTETRGRGHTDDYRLFFRESQARPSGGVVGITYPV